LRFLSACSRKRDVLAEDGLEGLDRLRAVELAGLGDAEEELGRDVVVAVVRHLAEQRDRLAEVALLVVEAAEQVVELVADLVEGRVLEVGRLVGADLLEHAGALGQLAAQRREPGQRQLVVRVVRARRRRSR
jgi:hypothetical protein